MYDSALLCATRYTKSSSVDVRHGNRQYTVANKYKINHIFRGMGRPKLPSD